MAKYTSQKPSKETRAALGEFPKVFHSILLEGHNFLYQGLVPDLALLPVQLYELSRCCSMNLSALLAPNAYVRSTNKGYVVDFSAGLVFSALEMAFFISACIHPSPEDDFRSLAKKLKSRLTDCSHWRNVKGPAQFTYLDDPILWEYMKKASPLCPHDEQQIREVFGVLLPIILSMVAMHERAHIMWGHLRLASESKSHDDSESHKFVRCALELHADIGGAVTLIAYLSQRGASKRQMKIAGYCVLGALIIMHYAQQGGAISGYHPVAKIRYMSIRNILLARDGVFHKLPISVSWPLLDGFTELAITLDEHQIFGATFGLFHGAFEDWAKISSEIEAFGLEDDPSFTWDQYFRIGRYSYMEGKQESYLLLSVLLDLIDSKLKSYADEVFIPDRWKLNASLSWIGGEHELE